MFLTYALEPIMPEKRNVRLFRYGSNQAVRIPVEFELPLLPIGFPAASMAKLV